MAHVFTLEQLDKLPLYNEDNVEIGYYWFIVYRLETDMGNYFSQYTAEAHQLSEDPQLPEIEALILSLYGPGYDATAGGNEQ